MWISRLLLDNQHGVLLIEYFTALRTAANWSQNWTIPWKRKNFKFGFMARKAKIYETKTKQMQEMWMRECECLPRISIVSWCCSVSFVLLLLFLCQAFEMGKLFVSSVFCFYSAAFFLLLFSFVCFILLKYVFPIPTTSSFCILSWIQN